MATSLLEQVIAEHARQEVHKTSVDAFRLKSRPRPEGMMARVIAREGLSGAGSGAEGISVARREETAPSVSELAEKQREADELAGFRDLRKSRPNLTLEQYRAMSLTERCKIILSADQPAEVPMNSVERDNREQDNREQESGNREQEPVFLLSPEGKEPRIDIPAEGSGAQPQEGDNRPVVTSESEALMYELIEDYKHGYLKPAPIELGALPAYANEASRRMAADIALLMGLRKASGDDRPLPYGTAFACNRMEWKVKDPRRASKILRRLVRWGVIECVGEMPKRGKGNGTKLYAPPGE